MEFRILNVNPLIIITNREMSLEKIYESANCYTIEIGCYNGSFLCYYHRGWSKNLHATNESSLISLGVVHK